MARTVFETITFSCALCLLAACGGTSSAPSGDAGDAAQSDATDAASSDAASSDAASSDASDAAQSDVDAATTDADTADADTADADTADADADAGVAAVAIVGRQLRVNGTPFQIKGVCWNPVPQGGNHPADLDYAGAVATDAALMQAAGINVVRTYEPLLDTDVLDALYARGIYVIESIYPWGGAPVSVVTDRVRAVVDHPAVLMWALGNEWNYNGLYVGLSHADALARLNEAAALIRAEDPVRPIATIYGEVPSEATVDAMPLVDIWGLNVYRGIGFGDLFDVWATRSDKPMFLGEYGADAYNALTNMVDVASQAAATTALTQSILDHASAVDPSDVCAGGTIFEWSDEWWKDGDGNTNTHDVGGVAPGGGPHPDATFNEEWWGVVDIDRNVRPAYTALQTLYVTE